MDKRCSTCHEIKPVKKYHKNISSADGYQNVCKDCKAVYHKKSYKLKGRTPKPIPTHIECKKCNTVKPVSEFRQRSDRRVPTSPCKDCERKYSRERYKIKKHDTVYMERRRKKNNRFAKEYNQRLEVKKRRKHQSVVWAENRRARKQNGCGVTQEDWEEILNTYNGKCLACGSSEDISMDHVIPLCKNGKHEPENIQPLCLVCNSSKGVKEIDYR